MHLKLKVKRIWFLEIRKKSQNKEVSLRDLRIERIVVFYFCLLIFYHRRTTNTLCYLTNPIDPKRDLTLHILLLLTAQYILRSFITGCNIF